MKMAKNKLPEKGRHETRAFATPDLQAVPEGNILEGHAAVFGQTIDMCGCWTETIARGAFDRTDFTNVKFDVNHNLSSVPLARSRNNNANSTLYLQVDDQGLAIRASLDVEKNVDSQALYSAVTRGDISGMSFIFTVRTDEWTDLDTDMPSRAITDIAQVYEVSAVSFPAYDGTDINARDASALDGAKKILESIRATRLESLSEQRSNQTDEKKDTQTDVLELERLKALILMRL
jgi:HK97 family phage prohead protease